MSDGITDASREWGVNKSVPDDVSHQDKMKDNWKHRSLGMVCKTCVFFVRKKRENCEEEKLQLGRCRRNAPTMKGFPVVFGTDWCGDHRLDENKI